MCNPLERAAAESRIEQKIDDLIKRLDRQEARLWGNGQPGALIQLAERIGVVKAESDAAIQRALKETARVNSRISFFAGGAAAVGSMIGLFARNIAKWWP